MEPGPQTQVPVLAFPGSFWDSRKFGAPWRNLKVTGAQGHNWDKGGNVKPFMGAAFKNTFDKQSALL